MKNFSFLLWLCIPLGGSLLYSSIQYDAHFVEWLSIGLLIYVLFCSVVVHELSHGLAAYWCGDETAKRAGRLTLNPLSHVSLVGSILVPLGLYAMQASVIFGWAKPVPFNPINLRRHPRDQVMIAVAGPLSNFSLAYLCFNLFLLFGLLFNHLYPQTPIFFQLDLFSALRIGQVPCEGCWFTVFEILRFGMVINVILGVFNLIPFPPLDGSWIVKALLPKKLTLYFGKIQLFGFILLILALQFNLLQIFFYPVVLILSLLQLIANICLG